jgi:hypothetical protein
VKTILLSNNPSHSNKLIPPGRVIRMAAALGILLAALAFSSSHAATVTTNGFDLFVNGSRMVIKGMNYSPVPIGAVPGNPPYGDYFVPADSNVWTPDIQSMRAAGVNAIKLYAGNPALNAGQPGSAGNWKAFLDACYNGGTNPIYVVMFSYIQGDVIAAGGDRLSAVYHRLSEPRSEYRDASGDPWVLRWQRDLWWQRHIQFSILGQLWCPPQRRQGGRPRAECHTFLNDGHQRRLHSGPNMTRDSTGRGL